MKKILFRTVFFFSILFNLSILVLGGIFVHKKGGLDYLRYKIGILKYVNIPYHHSYRASISLFGLLPNSEVDVYFLGDSITRQGEWHEIFKDLNCKNRAISGDTTKGVLYRLNEVIEGKPKKVFILLGINDIMAGETKDKIIANYNRIVTSIRKLSPLTKIYVQSILPINTNKFHAHFSDKDYIYEMPQNASIVKINKGLEELSQTYPEVIYVDLYHSLVDSKGDLEEDFTIDGLHLTGSGIMAWGDFIRRYVNE